MAILDPKLVGFDLSVIGKIKRKPFHEAFALALPELRIDERSTLVATGILVALDYFSGAVVPADHDKIVQTIDEEIARTPYHAQFLEAIKKKVLEQKAEAEQRTKETADQVTGKEIREVFVAHANRVRTLLTPFATDRRFVMVLEACLTVFQSLCFVRGKEELESAKRASEQIK